jgi:hypothetical protein
MTEASANEQIHAEVPETAPVRTRLLETGRLTPHSFSQHAWRRFDRDRRRAYLSRIARQALTSGARGGRPSFDGREDRHLEDQNYCAVILKQ